ncbi:MAG: hypothetical protein SGI77_09140 [Pirellulaceae bacterium]|nr:hypothetical protein [Pirellulaceae bacterium]
MTSGDLGAQRQVAFVVIRVVELAIGQESITSVKGIAGGMQARRSPITV